MHLKLALPRGNEEDNSIVSPVTESEDVMPSPQNAIAAGSRMRFRSYAQADENEKSLAEWLVQDVFPDNHDHSNIKQARFSKQYLFDGDKALQNLIIIPSNYADYPHFYIIYMEGPDNPAVIGDNIFSEYPMLIHSTWVINGAKVLSSTIDGNWVSYVYNGEQYYLTTPSRRLPALIRGVGVDPVAAPKRHKMSFARGYSDLRPFELSALERVKAVNEGVYSDDDYRALRVSAQYMSKSNRNYLDIFFWIKSTTGDTQPYPSYFEIAIQAEGGGYEYGGYTLPYFGIGQSLSVSKDDYINGRYCFIHDTEAIDDMPAESVKWLFDGLGYRPLLMGSEHRMKLKKKP
jgi:hypothetical protein